MLNNAIFITEEPNVKNNRKFDSYRYYVVGLNIDGVSYTAKIVIGVKQGKKYYDHRLTQIEKSRLIDNINQPTLGFTTEGNASLPPYAVGKDTILFSILQTNSSKVVDENGEPLVVYHGFIGGDSIYSIKTLRLNIAGLSNLFMVHSFLATLESKQRNMALFSEMGKEFSME